jgi:hypothetical protein
MQRGLAREITVETSVFTRAALERVVRFVCELVMTRLRRRLTVSCSSPSRWMWWWPPTCSPTFSPTWGAPSAAAWALRPALT